MFFFAKSKASTVICASPDIATDSCRLMRLHEPWVIAQSSIAVWVRMGSVCGSVGVCACARMCVRARYIYRKRARMSQEQPKNTTSPTHPLISSPSYNMSRMPSKLPLTSCMHSASSENEFAAACDNRCAARAEVTARPRASMA